MENINVFRLEETMALESKEFIVYTCLTSGYEKPVKIHSLGQCNLCEGGEYFYLDLFERIKNSEVNIKNLIFRIYNNLLASLRLTLR